MQTKKVKITLIGEGTCFTVVELTKEELNTLEKIDEALIEPDYDEDYSPTMVFEILK